MKNLNFSRKLNRAGKLNALLALVFISILAIFALNSYAANPDITIDLEYKEGTLAARTINPDEPDSKGLGDTDRAKYNKTN